METSNVFTLTCKDTLFFNTKIVFQKKLLFIFISPHYQLFKVLI